jgi:hypothetical protein
LKKLDVSSLTTPTALSGEVPSVVRGTDGLPGFGRPLQLEESFMKALVMILLLLLTGVDHAEARYNDINYALSISGGNYVSVPNHNSLNNGLVLGLRFSIDAWVKPTAIGNEMAIVGNGFAYWFGLDTSGKLRLRLNNQQVFTGNAVIGTTGWTHVAVALDIPAGFVRFYINGALDRNISHTGSLSGNTGALCLGADIAGAGAPIVVTPWNGSLDEVRVWRAAIDFSTALGALTRTAHAVRWGLYGQYLVSAWQLNGGYLDNCGGNHGTMVGSGTFTSTQLPPFYERIGLAFQNQNATGGGGFSVATIANSASLNLTTSYTVEFWMKPAAMSGHPSFQTLVCKGLGQAGVMAFWIGLNKSNGKIRFAPYGNFTTTHESTVSVPINQWTHIGVSFGPSPQGGYRSLIVINGNIAGLANLSQPTPSTTHGVLIGAGATDPGASNVYGYEGVIDELRIWSSTRSYDEIADNHRIELDGTQSGLAALYHFDGTIRDVSGNSNHSTDLVPTSTAYFVSTTDLPGPPSISITEPTANAVWRINESRHIRYQAIGLPWLRLELSRDGGVTYPDTLIRGASGPQGEFIWPVEGPASSQCRIRAVTVTPTSVGDTSDVFSIEEALPQLNVSPVSAQFTAKKDADLPAVLPLRIWNTGGGMLQWSITTSNPSWLYLSALAGSSNNQTLDLAVTTTALPVGEYTETLTVNSNATNGPIVVLVTYRITDQKTWTVSGLVGTDSTHFRHVRIAAEGAESKAVYTGEDSRYTIDLAEGDWTITPRSWYFTFTPPQRTYMPLNDNDNKADFDVTTVDTWVTFRYHQGWNLVSIPVAMAPTDMNALFPAAIAPAYIFDPDSGYLPRTEIRQNVAYWMQFMAADSVQIFGTLFRYTWVNTSTKISGWVMIPTPSGDVGIADIEQDPAGNIVRIFAYDPVRGYTLPDDGLLHSGKAYFLKAAADGHILMRAREPEDSAPPPYMFPALDASMDTSELPPPPPQYD